MLPYAEPSYQANTECDVAERGVSGPEAGSDGGGVVLSAWQQEQQDSYDDAREQVRQLRRTAAAKRDTKEFAAAMTKLLKAADQLCSQAEDMPALMDQEAQTFSRRLLRGSAVALLALAGVLALMVVLDVRAGWWWIGVAILIAAGGVLMLSGVAPEPGQHRRQRRPAVICAGLGLLGVLSTLTPWWWAAALLTLGALGAALTALEPPEGPQQPGGAPTSSGASRASGRAR